MRTAGHFGALLGDDRPSCLVCEGKCTHERVPITPAFQPRELDPMAEYHVTTGPVWVTDAGTVQDGRQDGYLLHQKGARIPIAEARRLGLVPAVSLPVPLDEEPEARKALRAENRKAKPREDR